MTHPDDRRPAEIEWAVVVPPAPAAGAPGVLAPPVASRAGRPLAGRALVAACLATVVVTAAAGVVVLRAAQSRAGRAAAAAELARGSAMGSVGASYAFTWVNPDGAPVRWNPCRPIEWVTSSAAAPAGALADFRGALERVAALTGLTFRYRGEVDESPSTDRDAAQARYGRGWSPMLVSWAPLAGTPLGAGLGTGADTVGVATPVAVSRPGSPGVIVSAQIVFESGRPLPAGFATSGARGAVMLHELAHALGLAHVSDPSQLMFDGDHQGSGPGELRYGDAAGLEQLGAGGGCLPEPAPGEVD